MKILDWMAKRLVGALRREFEALRATESAHFDSQAKRLDDLAGRVRGISTTLDERHKSARGHLETRLDGHRKMIGRHFDTLRAEYAKQLADQGRALRERIETVRAQLETRLKEERDFERRVDKTLAHIEKKRREETPRQVRAELTSVLGLINQHINWSKDTARMVGELRAEMRLLTEAPDQAAPIADGESDDPRLLRRYVEGSNIRELYPTELFDGIGELSLPIASINEESGHGNQVDLMYVVAIARMREARNIFEFGTYLGRTTYHLTFASEDAHVTTLNLPPGDEAEQESLGRMFRGTDREARITQLLEDSAAFDPAPYAESMDFIFVDADHSYELVKNDTEKALVMLKPGGAIVWHDYAVKSPGVIRYIQEFAEKRSVFRLKHTCLIVYLDGVDAMTFQPSQRTSAELQQVTAPPDEGGEERKQA